MIQTRTNTIQDFQIIRQEDTGVPTRIEGYAALFNTLSEPIGQLGGARELIAPGAFTRALERNDNVVLTINHDPNLLLARSTSGTLTLRQDEKGLFFSASLPNTTYANDLIESMNRGDINQNSFAMVIDKQDWEKRGKDRVSVVKDVHLFDVSVVVNPAYTQTYSQLRELANTQNTELINSEVKQNESVLSPVATVDGLARRKRELELLTLDQ
jgi:uncharacterized protein